MRKLNIQYRQSETKKKVIHKLFWQIVLYHDSYIGEEKMEIVQEMVDQGAQTDSLRTS